jgi:hypothetical protein
MYNDLEKLNFSSLSDLEKLEIGNKLTVNYNTLILQLTALHQYGLAGVLQLALEIQQLNPNRLMPLLDYMAVLHNSAMVDAKIRIQNSQTILKPQELEEKTQEEVPDIDLGDKEQ